MIMEYSNLIGKKKDESSNLFEADMLFPTSGSYNSVLFIKDFSRSIDEYDVLIDKPLTFVGFKEIHHEAGRTQEVEPGLSSLRLDVGGIINEKVIRIRNISAQIIEITKDHVILECLMDKVNRVYHKQNILKEILEGIIPFQKGQLILIKMKDLKGGNSIEYINGDRIISPDDFNVDDFFEGLDGSFIDFEG